MTAAGMNARWWTMRRAQNLKPATYVCPLCDGMLHAASEHVLIAPEGDLSKRRHAHLECVLAARKRGDLPNEDDFKRRARR
ncbi:MAG: hypothetical protein ACJ75S_05175 [Solirubrobacterales bacterium]